MPKYKRSDAQFCSLACKRKAQRNRATKGTQEKTPEMAVGRELISKRVPLVPQKPRAPGGKIQLGQLKSDLTKHLGINPKDAVLIHDEELGELVLTYKTVSGAHTKTFPVPDEVTPKAPTDRNPFLIYDRPEDHPPAKEYWKDPWGFIHGSQSPSGNRMRLYPEEMVAYTWSTRL